MNNKKVIKICLFAGVSVLYLSFVYSLKSFQTPIHKPKILGITSTGDPSTLADKISQQFQDLEQTNQELQYSVSTAKFLASFPRILRRGMTGQDVTMLQSQLNQLEKSGASVDVTGHFGKSTEASLKRFQTIEAVKATGILDIKTKEKMAEASVQRPDAESIDIDTLLQELLKSQQLLDQVKPTENIIPIASSTVPADTSTQDTSTVVCPPVNICDPYTPPDPTPTNSTPPPAAATSTSSTKATSTPTSTKATYSTSTKSTIATSTAPTTKTSTTTPTLQKPAPTPAPIVPKSTTTTSSSTH